MVWNLDAKAQEQSSHRNRRHQHLWEGDEIVPTNQKQNGRISPRRVRQELQSDQAPVVVRHSHVVVEIELLFDVTSVEVSDQEADGQEHDEPRDKCCLVTSVTVHEVTD